ncbi:hypothetical protein BO99DRAFT_137769 [Aspergillus violaceofuscus CBS 115571]|uniref:Uncharacterized protein n=1 Tax=Aspergillus violaceofuscus (strain CBS 115571) TaxID=1450538 RepID=A0A2V5H603_ASPV1|nr:hypothetical protein BO99DRAFT_137769 [Aspergillus violaceofuscus CBS 115571]
MRRLLWAWNLGVEARARWRGGLRAEKFVGITNMLEKRPTPEKMAFVASNRAAKIRTMLSTASLGVGAWGGGGCTYSTCYGSPYRCGGFVIYANMLLKLICAF